MYLWWRVITVENLVLTKSRDEIFATKRESEAIFKGYFESDFSGWKRMGNSLFAPIDVVLGIEKQRNKYLLHNYIDNNIYPIRFIDCATIDNKEFFIHLFLGNGELFIPIR